MKKKPIPTKIYLTEDEMPKSWYNLRADMKEKHEPFLNPATLKEVTAEDLGHIFCDELVKQELDQTTRYIEIPDMGVCLPVFPGATGEHLARGAAIMDQTSMPLGGAGTNCVIAGHRGYRGSPFFQYIDHMKEGSEVTLVTPWETLRYQAVETKVIDPCDWEDLKICPDKDRLTLISCHPYGGGGRYRYVR